MGGPAAPSTPTPEVYEAADPARTMPKGLVFGALALLAIWSCWRLTWLSNRSLEPDEVVAEAADNVAAPVANEVAARRRRRPRPRPVVLTATDAVWLEIKDGATVLKQGEMAAGERFEVPARPPRRF